MYESDPVWYAVPCGILYVLIVPLVLPVFLFLMAVSVFGYSEWAYRRLDDLIHLLP